MSTAPDNPRANHSLGIGTVSSDSQSPPAAANPGDNSGSLRASLGDQAITPTQPTFDIQVLSDHNVLMLFPGLNEAAWGDVVSVGTAILERLEQARTNKLLVDLSQLDYMGSSQVALLVRVWKVLKAREGRMAVLITSDFVHKVLTIAGLHTLWDIVPTRAAAQRALGVRVTKETVAKTAALGNAGEPTASEQGVAPILVALGVLFAAFVILVLGHTRIWTGALEVRLGALMLLSGIAVMCGVWSTTRIIGPLRVIGLGVCLAGFVMGITAALEWPRSPISPRISRPADRSFNDTVPSGEPTRGVAPVSVRASRAD